MTVRQTSAMARHNSLGVRVRVAVAAVAGVVAVRLLGWTWRVVYENPEEFGEGGAPRRPVVIALWHGELLPLVWAHRGHGIAALISTSADGEVISRVLRRLGFRPIRGSTSRGGARALLEAVAALRGGRSVAFTVDGPRGPRRTCAPGAASAAARAGVPVIAMGARVDRRWVAGTWDRFVIPRPFAVIRVRYSLPLVVAGAGDAEELRPRVRDTLMSVCAPDAA